MKQLFYFRCVAASVALIFFTAACNGSAGERSADEKNDTAQVMTTQTDPAALKAEIQEQESAWAKADDARDVNALAAFYSDDAVSMANNAPMLVGGAAIRKDLESSLAKRPKGSTTTYDVIDVFGSGNYATETGKTTRKDSTGKILSTGKYMAVWEKRDGKWICIRDISNEDAKESKVN